MHYESGVNPVWKDKLEFKIDSLTDLFTIGCYDEDAMSNDLVGDTQLSIAKLTSVQFGFDQWVVLRYDGKVAGNIKLRCFYDPPWPAEGEYH